MDPDLIIARARRAKLLLGTEDFVNAVDDVEREMFAEWQTARTSDDRESLHATNRALSRVVAKLKSWADELALRNIE